MKRKFTLALKIFLFFITVNMFFDFSLLLADTSHKAKITLIKTLNHSDTSRAGLEDEILLRVINAPELSDDTLKSPKVILFFEGMPLKGIYPRKNTIDSKGNGKLVFFIPLNDQATKLWSELLKVSGPGNFFERKVCVNVGLENPDNNQLSLVTDEQFFTIILVRVKWFWLSIFILVILLVLFLTLAVKSDIIRDTECNPPGGARRPFSLARTQMAVWTFAIISAWLIIYVIQYRLNSITDSMAVLMGISSATGLGSVAVSAGKEKRMVATQGLLKDLLSDESGISIHRFQIFAWTIIMLVVFCRQVIYFFEMPEFNTSLLVLMGISSGTYIGYKYTEKPSKQGVIVPVDPAKTDSSTITTK